MNSVWLFVGYCVVLALVEGGIWYITRDRSK